ncbi:hypothetical protein Tco_0568720 [Tanacetum coccineum]
MNVYPSQVAVVRWLGGDGWLCDVVRRWGGGGGVDEVVTMGTVVGMTRYGYKGGDGSDCHGDEGGDDGGGFSCGRSWPEIAGAAPDILR